MSQVQWVKQSLIEQIKLLLDDTIQLIVRFLKMVVATTFPASVMNTNSKNSPFNLKGCKQWNCQDFVNQHWIFDFDFILKRGQ